jgi:hypothetical protein
MRTKICTIYAVRKLHGFVSMTSLLMMGPVNETGPACIHSPYSNCAVEEMALNP